MQSALEQQNSLPFVDRRGTGDSARSGVPERRQFSSSPTLGRPEVTEFAEAVDQYKLRHRRRFITFEELFEVMTTLGYHK